MNFAFANAARLVNTIRNYWMKRGFTWIDVKLVPLEINGFQSYAIKSNIGKNGYPQQGIAAT